VPPSVFDEKDEYGVMRKEQALLWWLSAKIVCPSVPSHGVILFHIHSKKERRQQ